MLTTAYPMRWLATTARTGHHKIMRGHQLQTLFFDQALALLPERADVLQAFILARMRGGNLEAGILAMSDADGAPSDALPCALPEGVADIVISGTLTAETNNFDAMSGFISHGQVVAKIQAARQAGYGAALVRLRTPGGHVERGAEAARRMAELVADFPVTVYADETIASMGMLHAFALASGPDSAIVVPKAGHLGSLGVIGRTGSALSEGGEVYYSRFPSGKAMGQPGEGVNDEMRARLDESIKTAAQLFLSDIEHYGGPSLAQAVAMDGRMFTGEQAKEQGLAARVGTIEEELDRLGGLAKGRTSVSMSSTENGGRKMALKTLTALSALIGAAEIDEGNDAEAYGALVALQTEAAKVGGLNAELVGYKAAADRVPALEKARDEYKGRAELAEGKVATLEANADRETYAAEIRRHVKSDHSVNSGFVEAATIAAKGQEGDSPAAKVKNLAGVQPWASLMTQAPADPSDAAKVAEDGIKAGAKSDGGDHNDEITTTSTVTVGKVLTDVDYI